MNASREECGHVDAADVVHVVDNHGDRFVVMFPCERCGARQRYCFVEHTAKCPSCDARHGAREITAV
jgi:hypothetical protein